MGKLSIALILMCVAMSISGNHARKQAMQADPDHDREESSLLLFQDICQGNVRLAKMQFYVQDVLAGENMTVHEVARASITSNSPTTFGQVRVLDNLITAKPDPKSRKVGRVQGLITSSDLEVTALATNLNFYFTVGNYNGSTISILGRNEIMNQERELPVVGGTGVFRFASGYAVTKTYSYDVETSHGVLEYTLYMSLVQKSSSNMDLPVLDM